MYNIALISKEAIADGTMLFRFTKPTEFKYQAGQSIDVTLIDPKETDAEGNIRAFSISSSPQEDSLAIATRMRDTAFKRTLRNMDKNTEISIQGPFGSFFLHENTKRPAIFLSGGIGITPFRAIIKDATERALPHTLILFYSNRRPEDAAFLAELQNLQKQNPNFTLVATMTDMGKSAQTWEGERGYIDGVMLKKYIPEGTQPVYYLAGPATMVAAMRMLLNKNEISGDDIRFEEFTGY
jgi:ferredoxin-NADP reductase